jgi:hypothetical protein
MTARSASVEPNLKDAHTTTIYSGCTSNLVRSQILVHGASSPRVIRLWCQASRYELLTTWS